MAGFLLRLCSRGQRIVCLDVSCCDRGGGPSIPCRQPKDPGWPCPPMRECIRRPSVGVQHSSRMRRHRRRGKLSNSDATLIFRTDLPTVTVPATGRASSNTQTRTVTVYLTPNARHIIRRRHAAPDAKASTAPTEPSPGAQNRATLRP